MPRYRLVLDYKGTRYSGWQVQPKDPSIQEDIERALFRLTKSEVRIVGCGRTDAGVHARNYVAHFDLPYPVDTEVLLYRMNRFLAKDILIHCINEVGDDFHSRFHATFRTYKYTLSLAPSPFIGPFCYICPYEVDFHSAYIEQINQLLLQETHFFPFCKSKSDVTHYSCRMLELQWEEIAYNRWVFTISANRFLRGMVRLIVGMYINVLRKKLALAEVAQALKAQRRLLLSWSAPPEGLLLYNVGYEEGQSKDWGRSDPIFYPM